MDYLIYHNCCLCSDSLLPIHSSKVTWYRAGRVMDTSSHPRSTVPPPAAVRHRGSASCGPVLQPPVAARVRERPVAAPSHHPFISSACRPSRPPVAARPRLSRPRFFTELCQRLSTALSQRALWTRVVRIWSAGSTSPSMV